MEFTGERFVPHLTEMQIKVEHLQRYLSITELVKGKIVIDAACGEGYGSSILSDTANKVIGIDISDETIKHANTVYSKENLSFLTASIENLPVEDHSIDVIVSFETIEHVNEYLQQSFLNEIKRVLKHDGILIISTPNKHIYSDLRNYQNPFHIKEFYKDEFHRFLGSYFKQVEIFHQKNEVASVITSFSDEETIRQIKFEQDRPDVEGTYFIAICSDKNIGNLKLGSSILFADKYSEMLNRILSLQDEVEDKNKHIKYLDGNISDLSLETKRLKDLVIDLQEKTIDLQEKLIDSLNENIKLKQDSEKRLMDYIKEKVEIAQEIQNKDQELKSRDQELKNKDHEIQNIDQELKNKDGHIKLLLESDRTLNNIYRSSGWKLLTKYYSLRDMVIPKNSKRRLVVKLVSKSIKQPRKMIGSLNKANLKKLKYYMSTEDVGNIESRIDHYMDRHKEVKQTEIKLFDSNQIKEKIVFPKCGNPLVSIIVPVYNQWDYTYSCLKSISMNTDNITYEVIIADDMSNDETIHILKYIENVHVVRDGVNRGFLLNCNNAAKQAKGKYIFFLNNDTNVQEDWLKNLVDLVENNSTIGMVGSKLVYPDGRLQEAGGIIWNDASGWNYGRLDDPSKPEYNYVKEVDYISGAAIMIRAELWNQIGGFDERYVPAYFEDSDLAFEVRKLGYKVVFQPKSVVVHFEGVSHGIDVSSGIKSYQEKNKEKFIKKWGEILTKEQFVNAEHVFLARDRSKSKQTILVIDHYVPHYDKDAGSRTVFQYLKLFIELGMNVKFIGDNYFKHDPYTSVLENMGVEVLYGDWFARNFKDWLKINGEYFDFTFLNRPHISIKYIDDIKKYTKSKVFYYGHDLHYLRETREYQLTKNEELLKSAQEWRKIESKLIESSDYVYYPSQVEVDELKQQFGNSNIKSIPAYIYGSFSENLDLDSFSDRKDLLFVGGFAHKPNIDAVLWFVTEIFPDVIRAIPEIRLYIVGSNPPESIKRLHSMQIIVTGFVTDEELVQYYQKCRIDVVPLRFGAGVKGKVVEALYHRIPIITTHVGSEGLNESSSYMIECDDSREFSNAIVELYKNERKLRELSERSQEFVQKYFSKESVLKTIRQDFDL